MNMRKIPYYVEFLMSNHVVYHIVIFLIVLKIKKGDMQQGKSQVGVRSERAKACTRTYTLR